MQQPERSIDTKKAKALPMSRAAFSRITELLFAYQCIDEPMSPKELHLFVRQHLSVKPFAEFEISVHNRLLYKLGWIDGNRPRFHISHLGRKVLKAAKPDLNLSKLGPLFQESLMRFQEISLLFDRMKEQSAKTREDWIFFLEQAFLEINEQSTTGRTNAVFYFDLFLTADVLRTTDYKTYAFYFPTYIKQVDA